MKESITYITTLSPTDSGERNREILQEAADRGGEIRIGTPGIYKIAGTVYLGSHTHIIIEPGVYFERAQDPDGVNGNAFINRGAFTGICDEDISIEGLRLNVCGVEHCTDYRHTEKTICGLRGHLAFLYIKNLTLRNVVVMDLYKLDYGIQISDFEHILVENIRVEGQKDGIHFGPGRDFVLRNAIFRTFDDPIALNGSDYSVSNPNLGWIEDGLIENCWDLEDTATVGFFARFLCGGWVEWFPGMEVQHSDAVVYNGRLYRVVMRPNGEVFRSENPPCHETGYAEVDGIVWHVIHPAVPYTAGVRRVTLRNIHIRKKREAAVGIYIDRSDYLRSYYPNAEVPQQTDITLENVFVTGEVEKFIWSNCPMDRLTLKNCELGGAALAFERLDTEGLSYPTCHLTLENVCGGAKPLIRNPDAYPLEITEKE